MFLNLNGVKEHEYQVLETKIKVVVERTMLAGK